MAKKPAPKTSPYVAQAQQAANLKYGPLVQALGVLQQTADSTYMQGRQQADSAAKSIIAAADSAKGGLQDMLTRVGGYSGDTAAKLGITATSPLANEAAIQAGNLGLSGQAAMAQLQNAKVRGAQAGVFQQNQARQQYLSDTGKIKDQYTGIQGQSGDYAESVLEKLLQNAGDRQLSYAELRAKNAQAEADRKNAADIAAGHDATSRANNANTVANRPTPKPTSGPGSATNSTVKGFSNDYQSAKRYADQFKTSILSGALDPAAVQQLLTTGRGGKTHAEPLLDAQGKPVLMANGQPRMTTVKTPGIPAIKNNTAVRAAVENSLYGGISSATAQALHTQGIRAADVGLTILSPAQLAKLVAARKKAAPTVSAIGNVSGAINSVLGGLSGAGG